MKKIIFLLLLSTTLFSQNQLPSTTYEEYLYLTKGYRQTLTDGLDLKRGYELKDFRNYSDSSYSFDFKLFINQKTKKTSAILVIAKSKVWNNFYFFCIPINNPDLYLKYYADLSTWDSLILSSYSYAISQIFSDFISLSEN